jgi:NAD(P)-dependent dehydrogenase (short-subunit alcohol dehydrogenase family)
LDVTSRTDIRRAVQEVGALDLLINNAGLAIYVDLDDRAAFEAQLAVNLYGTYDVTQAFRPLLVRSGGSIVNNLSLNALAPLVVDPAYAVSKAAAWSLTQSLRAVLTTQGVSVHAVLTGPVDTDMTRGLPIPKASPESVASAIFDGLENGDEDIFPDPWSRTLVNGWSDNAAKTLERQFAAFVVD